MSMGLHGSPGGGSLPLATRRVGAPYNYKRDIGSLYCNIARRAKNYHLLQYLTKNHGILGALGYFDISSLEIRLYLGIAYTGVCTNLSQDVTENNGIS